MLTPAGDPTAKNPIRDIRILHAEDNTPGVDKALRDLMQGKDLPLLIDHAAHGGQNHIFSGEFANPGEGAVEAFLGDKGRANSRLSQRLLRLLFDGDVGAGAIAHEDQVVGIFVEGAEPVDIRDHLLQFEDAGGLRGIKSPEHAVIIHPGKENRRSWENAGEVIAGKQKGVVIGHIDRRGPIPGVFLL